MLLSRFKRSESGNFALIIAICAAPLFGGIALAVDYVALNQQKSSLQEVVDGSALAVAKEMALPNSNSLDVQNIAENYIASQFDVPDADTLTVTAKRSIDDDIIDIGVSYVWQPFFIQYLDDKALPIVVSAKAGFAGGKSSICVLSLDPNAANAMTVDSKSSVLANNCAIFTNSSSSSALALANNSTISAEGIIVSGGYSGNANDFKPQPITDSPAIADPLSDRGAPLSNVCDYKDTYLDIGIHTLKPGVYCGGLTLTNDAIGEMEPGVFVIKDGPLSIQGNATITGTHVGFYFTGDAAVFDFGVSTQASLTAPKTGELSGILFFEDRTSTPDRVFTIRSKDAEKFEGAIYLPKGTLFIDKESRVGQQSKWTSIIANRIDIGKGPQLEINSDYAGSDVPVPEGISGETQIRLLK